jgi:hypothetical protein
VVETADISISQRDVMMAHWTMGRCTPIGHVIKLDMVIRLRRRRFKRTDVG